MSTTDKYLDRSMTWMRDARVKLTRQLIAALTLLAWLFAGTHIALEHEGVWLGTSIGEAAHGGHHHGHDHAPGNDDEHHHDLGVATALQFSKFAGQQFPMPLCMPIYNRMIAELAAVLRDMGAVQKNPLIGASPPDERTSGCLLAVQTAQPVRGPSFAV